MKKFIKVLIYLLITIFILGVAVFGVCSYEGYQMYQKALQESGIEDRISKIRSKERLCYH